MFRKITKEDVKDFVVYSIALLAFMAFGWCVVVVGLSAIGCL